jgi:hypothetical protein
MVFMRLPQTRVAHQRCSRFRDSSTKAQWQSAAAHSFRRDQRPAIPASTATTRSRVSAASTPRLCGFSSGCARLSNWISTGRPAASRRSLCSPSSRRRRVSFGSSTVRSASRKARARARSARETRSPSLIRRRARSHTRSSSTAASWSRWSLRAACEPKLRRSQVFKNCSSVRSPTLRLPPSVVDDTCYQQPHPRQRVRARVIIGTSNIVHSCRSPSTDPLLFWTLPALRCGVR